MTGAEQTVPVEAVEIGERLAVHPGEKLPVDGIVREGSSARDQSPITGESVPVDKVPGDDVYAGTVNEASYLEIEATSTTTDSTLSRIIELIRTAEDNKTQQEQFVDWFASYYTPTLVVLAILTVLVPPMIIDDSVTLGFAGVTHTFLEDRVTWFVRGLTLLVIACPCAFVISTPVSVASGITAAARHGVLIKGGNHLEAMGTVDAIAFDKTGTLTTGNLVVTDVIPLGSTSEAEVLRYAGAVEQRSEHPIATAIVSEAAAAGIDLPAVTEFESMPGKGVKAHVGSDTYYVGKPVLFDDLSVDIEWGSGADKRVEAPASRSDADERIKAIGPLQQSGKTVVLVGSHDRLLGVIGIADEIRETAHRAVSELHDLGVAPLVMLTGDNEGTARAVASELGLDGYRAELLPGEKVDAIEKLAKEHGRIAMVGDGINDAPALAVASVGIAMGAAGTDTAIESADIALMGDDIAKLPYLYSIPNTTNSVIRQNIWSSLAVKLVLAVGVPFGYVSVALAIIVGDMGMSLGVTGNALRLGHLKPEAD